MLGKMNLLDFLIVAIFVVALAALIVLCVYQPLYGLAGIAILFVLFGAVVLLIRRANRPTSASIAAMRIKR